MPGAARWQQRWNLRLRRWMQHWGASPLPRLPGLRRCCQAHAVRASTPPCRPRPRPLPPPLPAASLVAAATCCCVAWGCCDGRC